MYEATVLAYYPKFNFNKGIHAMWELDVADDPEAFPCSYYDICHFMGKADKPCDYVCSDDEDAERDEVDCEDALSEDEEEEPRRAKAAQTTKTTKTPRKDQKSFSEGDFKYTVPSAKLSADDISVRRKIERLIHVPAMEFYWNTDDRAQFKMLRSIMPRELLRLFRTVLILLTNITVPT